MTRDEIRGIVEGISDEQLKNILDINSRDIKKAKENLEELKEKLEEAERSGAARAEEIEALKESQREAGEIKLKMEELQKVVDKKERAEKDALLEDAMHKRFEEVLKDRDFVNDFTRKGVFEKFKIAAGDEKNIGKADSEIFEQIVGGPENLFALKADAPKVVASAKGFEGKLSDGEIREIMGI